MNNYRFNRIHTNLKFTLELEQKGNINFLDINIYRTDNKFQTKVYRKPTAGDQYIHALSFHPQQIKHNVWFNFFLRAYNLCTEQETVQNEIQQIIEIGSKIVIKKQPFYN
jgi:hypothetical protein